MPFVARGLLPEHTARSFFAKATKDTLRSRGLERRVEARGVEAIRLEYVIRVVTNRISVLSKESNLPLRMDGFATYGPIGPRSCLNCFRGRGEGAAQSGPCFTPVPTSPCRQAAGGSQTPLSVRPESPDGRYYFLFISGLSPPTSGKPIHRKWAAWTSEQEQGIPGSGLCARTRSGGSHG